ncbi:putative membrane protein [Mycobacteroides abscessus 4S-0726-RB]|nr:putative membrane protein [Mycobacteroides abscessus 4S-0303]EIT92279.1 putative membrane protein [Mycobacteroides abscessus 4S-0726-RB]EIT95829.1 putative membrane protein [Mycobacteroides abscessus 4S-0726-RA]EIV08021.1 putative membrane protein [Mycobacteroides abscessus 4S-0206]EIV48076.1 putative membrane protein [Mycobacteroides abscessus 4S-0116-R]EIV60261.1 putative membrane protein [Mycobacteroides abscessus 4S-0116-S]
MPRAQTWPARAVVLAVGWTVAGVAVVLAVGWTVAGVAVVLAVG